MHFNMGTNVLMAKVRSFPHTIQPNTHKRVLFGEHRFHTHSILLSPAIQAILHKKFQQKHKDQELKCTHITCFSSHKKCKICEHTKPGKLLKKTAPTIILHLRFHSMQRQHHTNGIHAFSFARYLNENGGGGGIQ